jgi:tetratricopeptide (TPR) repeat protein
MPRRYYLFTIILLFLQCAAIFDRRNDFEKAIAHYHKADMGQAILYFNKYLEKNPGADTVLYFLYDCYRRQGDHPAQIGILETLAQHASADPHVYTILLRHYYTNSAYDRFFSLYGSVPDSIRPVLDARYVLTRDLYSRLCLGATHTAAIANDPVRHALARGYLPPVPDGMYYEQDTMTIGNFIITLDNLLEPTYPKHFYLLIHVPERSFLYLPYMRLIDIGILAYQRDIDPDMIVPVSMAVRAINIMVERGYFD